MNQILQLSFALLLVICLSGCAELAKHAETVKPTATLTGTRLVNINFEQADLMFDLEIENQNPIAINLAGLDYDLKIENQSLISGVTAQGLKIKPAATSKVQLPVSLKFDDLKKLPGEIWKQDNFAYQLDTKFIVDLPLIGEYAIPVSKTGELPVPKMPDIRIRDIAVKSLGLRSAELVAEVEINNPNAFDLGFSNFDYQLNVNRQSWGKGSINAGRSIPKKAKGVVEIPLQLDMLSIGQSAFQMLSSGQPFEYQLKGSVTLDTGIDLLRSYTLPLDVRGQVPLSR